MFKKPRALSVALALILTVSLMPVPAHAGEALWLQGGEMTTQAVNPYKGGYSNCTWTAWLKAYERLGVALPGWGNAGTWYGSAASAGYSVGASARANSIAVWRAGGSNTTGHVAFVTEVSGSRMYILEGNYKGGYHEGWVPTSGYEYGASWGGPLIGFIYLSGSSSGEPSSDVYVTPGAYTISPKHAPSSSLDIQEGSNKDGANVQIYATNGSLAQSFGVIAVDNGAAFKIKASCSDKALDVWGNSSAAGANIQQWEDNSTVAQRWTFRSAGDGYYFIRAANGLYLDVAEGGSGNGANVQLWYFNGSDAQKWRLAPPKSEVQAGVYAASPKHAPGQRLDISGGVTEAGTNLQLWSSNGTISQSFGVIPVGDGLTYKLQAQCSKLALDVKNGSATPGTNVWQWTDNGEPSQQWSFQDAGGGYYYIRAANGLYLDVESGGKSDGSNVWGYMFNGSEAQKWKLVASAKEEGKPSRGDTGNQPSQGGAGDQPSQGDYDSAGKIALTNAIVTGVKSKTYTGKALAQSPTVKVGGKALKAGADYTLAYSNNVKAGTATMTITGKGSYTGAKQVKFAIAKANVKSTTAAKVKAQKYRKGKAVKPSPKLTYKGKTLEKETDYTLSYKNNKKRGTATITVKGKGDFKGTKTVRFKIK